MPENLVEIGVVLDSTQAKREINGFTQTVASDSQKIGSELRGATSSFAADFRAAVEKAKQELSSLDAKVIETGRLIAEGAKKQLGRTPEQIYGGLDPQAQRALAAYQASLEATTKKTKELAESTSSVGEAGERAGSRGKSAFESMMGVVDRMLLRLVALQLIFDAIRAIGELIGQSISWEKLSVSFRSFTNETGNAAKNLTAIQQIARTTGQSAEDVLKLERSYEMLGESATQATEDTKTVAEYAAAFGVTVTELGKAFQAVKLQTGTVEQLGEVAFLLKDIASVKVAAALEHAKSVLSELETVENRIYQLEQRRTEEINRHADAVEQFGNRFKLGADILHRMVQHLDTSVTLMHVWQSGTEVATINMSAAGSAMARMLAIGNKRIEQEEGINDYTLQQMEQYGLIDDQFVLQAYHRQRDDDQRKQEYAHEDAQQNRRMQMLQAQLTLNQTLSAELEKHANLAKVFADYSSTAAAKIEEMQKAFQQIGQDLPGIAENLGKIAGFLARIAEDLDAFTRPSKPTPEGEKAHQFQREIERSVRPAPSWGPAAKPPEERPGAHSGFAQADIDREVKRALTIRAWASAGRGIELPPMTVSSWDVGTVGGPSAADLAAGLGTMTPAKMLGMFPKTQAEVAAAQTGPGAATQQQLMDWALGGGRGPYPGKYRQAQLEAWNIGQAPYPGPMSRQVELMDWMVKGRAGGAYPAAGAGAAQGGALQGGSADNILQQMLSTLQNMLQHDQQVFGQ